MNKSGPVLLVTAGAWLFSQLFFGNLIGRLGI